MTNNERDHFNPPNEPDKETTECEYCIGDGWVFADSDEVDKMNCPKCNGNGFIEY